MPNNKAVGGPIKGVKHAAAHKTKITLLVLALKCNSALLVVDDDELERRLLLRGKDSGRVDDANPEVIRKRIKEYNDKTAPVAEFYKSQNKFKSINGIGSVNEIFDAIGTVVDAY